MGAYRLSQKAFADVRAIYAYTRRRHDLTQARKYIDSLYSCFEHVAENRFLGRQADHLVRGLRRYGCQSHVIFYVPVDAGVRIVRVLHARMVATRRHFR